MKWISNSTAHWPGKWGVMENKIAKEKRFYERQLKWFIEKSWTKLQWYTAGNKYLSHFPSCLMFSVCTLIPVERLEGVVQRGKVKCRSEGRKGRRNETKWVSGQSWQKSLLILFYKLEGICPFSGSESYDQFRWSEWSWDQIEVTWMGCDEDLYPETTDPSSAAYVLFELRFSCFF